LKIGLVSSGFCLLTAFDWHHLATKIVFGTNLHKSDLLFSVHPSFTAAAHSNRLEFCTFPANPFGHPDNCFFDNLTGLLIYKIYLSCCVIVTHSVVSNDSEPVN
jgi:hypothetical protein